MKAKKKRTPWQRFKRKCKKKLIEILKDRERAKFYLKIILAVLLLILILFIGLIVHLIRSNSDSTTPAVEKEQMVKAESSKEEQVTAADTSQTEQPAAAETSQEEQVEEPVTSIDSASQTLSDSIDSQKAALQDEQKAKAQEEAMKNIERDADGEPIWDTSGAEKVVYLTFDDGPSELTPQFLDVLKAYGVHATFFVIYKPEFEEYYKREIEEGHAVQIHTATHDFQTVYSSVDAYMEDFWTCHNYVEQVTGVYPTYFRFPGGSANSYDVSNIVPTIARTMEDSGFQFVDWTTSTGDGSLDTVSYEMLPKIQDEIIYSPDRVVILAHDSNIKQETLDALPGIIEYFMSEGYAFGVISNGVDMSFTHQVTSY